MRETQNLDKHKISWHHNLLSIF